MKKFPRKRSVTIKPLKVAMIQYVSMDIEKMPLKSVAIIANRSCNYATKSVACKELERRGRSDLVTYRFRNRIVQ